MTFSPKQLRAEFWDKTLKKGRCQMAEVGDPCDSKMDAHHVIKQQTIRNNVPGEVRMTAQWDPRNGIPLCRKHHSRVTLGTDQVPKDRLPGEIWAFAADYGLSWVLERAYKEGAWTE